MAVLGRSSSTAAVRTVFSAVKMRGEALAGELGVPFVSLSNLRGCDRFDATVLVKHWRGSGDLIRRVSERLIFDPLDCWVSTRPLAGPREFWRWTHQQLQYDDILATSPACALAMKEALSDKDVGIHLCPHHADPRIRSDWFDDKGPVVYGGAKRYIVSAAPLLIRACQKIGRPLRLDFSNTAWKALQGASLVLHLRLPPEATALNRICKPQVKLENAAAAGCPCLATNDPCLEGLGHSFSPHGTNKTTSDWVEDLVRALEAPRLLNPERLADHVRRIVQLLSSERFENANDAPGNAPRAKEEASR